MTDQANPAEDAREALIEAASLLADHWRGYERGLLVPEDVSRWLDELDEAVDALARARAPGAGGHDGPPA